jgi:integrase
MDYSQNRIPSRPDLAQMSRQAHALQRSRRNSFVIVVPQNLKLLDQLRFVCRARHYSIRTEEAYVLWVRQYILFHNKTHPAALGGAQVKAFIEHLSVDRQYAASTVRQALCGIALFYRDVLKTDLPWIDGLITPKRPTYIPVVLSQREIQAIFATLTDTWLLIARILYGGGLRINEALEPRIKVGCYTHVLNKNKHAVVSPTDRLDFASVT